ncbi:MAG: DUF4832 domain-containing protein [Candidatus Fimimonas sp.]
MKTKLFALIITLCLLCTAACGLLSYAYAYEDYVPTFSEVKKDTFENMTDFPTDSSQVVKYFWDNSALFWVEGPVVSMETANPINGSRSLKYAPHGDSEGWTLPTSKLGVSANKTAGTAGGYLLKLEFSVRFSNVNKIAVKAYTSKDVQYQSIVIDGNYQQLDNDAWDDDPETKVEIQKYGEGANEYARVSYTIRSNVQYVTYYELGVQIDPAYDGEAYLILDDVTFSKENDPVIEYVPYRTGPVNEQFEGTLADSVFNWENNANADKNANLNVETTAITTLNTLENSVIKDDQSFIVYGLSSSQAVKLNSKTVNLAANNYKLYFKSKLYRTKYFGINVINAETGEVIYNFIVNNSTNERIDSVVNPLFDSSSFALDSNSVYTVYGEFAVEQPTDVYLQIVIGLSHKSGYAIFDDVNLLEGYQKPATSTTYPDSSAQKVEGTWNATYEDIDGVNPATALVLKDISAYSCGIAVCAIFVGGALSKKKKRYCAILLAVIMILGVCLAACKPQTESIPSGYQVVHPEKIEGKLDNPGIGWVVLEEPTYGGHIDIGSSGDLPEASLASLSTTWAHIETSEDNYDWTLCDQAVSYWNSTGRRVLLRISTDSCVWPYTYKATPDYLFEKYNVGYKMVDYTDPGPVSTAKVSDLRDPVYLERLDKFLNALYEHYKDNDMVDTVEIRGFGMWGEWHHGNSFESYEDRVTTLSNIIDCYYEAFANSGKTLAVSGSYDPDYISTRAYWAGDATVEQAYQNFVVWSAFDKAWRTADVTFRRDGGANALRYDLDEKMLAEAFRSGKRIPILGEYANNYAAITSPGSLYTLESALDDILYKIRPNNTTTLGWVAVELAELVNKGEEALEFINRGNTMMGYRLTVDEARFPTQASAGSSFTLKTVWSNSAVGIYPYTSPLEIKLLDQNNNVVYTYTDTTFDARTFVQGEQTNVYSQLTLPQNLQNGVYTVAVDIPFAEASETENGRIVLGMGGEIDDTRMYALGTIEVKDGVKIYGDNTTCTTWDKISNVKLDKNSVYTITFRYKPHMDMENFYFGNNDSYRFSLQSQKLGTTAEYFWQDISGEAGTKTVTVATGNASDYKICIDSVNFDEIGVDRVWIEKQNATSENFDKFDVEDESTIIYPVFYGSADVAPSMYNGCLALTTFNTPTKYLLAKTDSNNLPLTKGKMYSVTFDFKAGGNVGDGGYYFIALGDANSELRELTKDFTVVGEWYERDDTYVTKKTFNFLCEEDDLAIYFGLNTVGNYFIDNLIIVEQDTSSVVEGVDVGFAHNVIPSYTNIGLGHVDSFEKGTFQASGFNWGQYAWGRMTFNPNEIPFYDAETNTAALLGRVEAEAYDPKLDNVWFEFARSKREYYPFEGKKLYCVEFDYKILKSFGSDNVFCFFRDDTLADRFAQAVNYPIDLAAYQNGNVTYLQSGGDLTSGKSVGTDYHYKQYWLLGDHDCYQFMFCMHGLWEVSVDNVYIYEVNSAGEKI